MMTGSTAREFSLNREPAQSESGFWISRPVLEGIVPQQQDFLPTDATIAGARLLPSSVVVPIHSPKERVKARFRLLKRLGPNHDGEGAHAPNARSVDAAIAFIDRMTRHKAFFATLDDDGSAVIEFEDRAAGFFADITFLPDGDVECYRRLAGQPSCTYVGALNAEATRHFLEQELHIEF